jgi:hypothetical protein
MHACQSGGSGQAAEAEERDALDVGPQAHNSCNARLDRRHRQTRHSSRHDHVDVVGLQPRFGKGAGERPGAESHRLLEERVVGLAEVEELRIALEGEGEVPRDHRCAGVQAS